MILNKSMAFTFMWDQWVFIRLYPLKTYDTKPSVTFFRKTCSPNPLHFSDYVALVHPPLYFYLIICVLMC